MLREDFDDKPEEVHARGGMMKKKQYFQEMEKLEEVEGMNFTRMRMNKQQ